MDTYKLRQTMLNLLLRIEEDSGYSHLLINNEIKRNKISSKDIGLLTEVVYGTTQRKQTLDFYLAAFVKREIDGWVRMLLRMSVYQMVYLDRVPAHAIIHEAVEIAKQRGHQGIGSFVNGVLRTIQRKNVPKTAEISDPVERLAVETSHPEWLVKRWIDQYGFEETKAMCEANVGIKRQAIRIQPLKISRELVIEELTADGFVVRPSHLSKQGIIIEEGNIIHSRLFKEGYITIQDESSMLATELLNVKPNMHVLDTCSAPGGKVTHIAEQMEDQGVIDAYDLHRNKLKLINKRAKQLNLSIINTKQGDARTLHNIETEESYDRIIVDAPCSGFGVIKTKPDIKYSKSEVDIERLASIQLDILNSVAPLLKESGLLIYSTCTVDREENERVVQKFLKEQKNFKVDESFVKELPDSLQNTSGLSKEGLQLFPHTEDTNGFFISRLIKTN